MQQLLFPLLIVVLAVPLVLSFRKQKKMQQAAQDLQKSIGVGDRVMTTSGVYGTVVNADNDNTIELEIAPGVVTEWLRPAVREKVTPETDGGEATAVDAAGETKSIDAAASTTPETSETSGATVAPPLEQR